MSLSRFLIFVCGALVIIPSVLIAPAWTAPESHSMNSRSELPVNQTGKSWYFAVSGDSRDCGDLVMPKIAKSIENISSRTPVEFYWHMGDFRRMFDIDCDMLKRKYPNFDCVTRSGGGLGPDEMNEYLDAAWDDFIKNQIAPFGKTPVFLGIGNHELLANRTRNEYRRKFQKWLTQQTLHDQRNYDAANYHLYTNEGDTYYHFIKNGVDFIYLDNADATEFDAAQINWLSEVLKADGAAETAPSARKNDVTTIVVGMHAALPYSKSRNHGMDATCQGVCSGRQVYDMLRRAQTVFGKKIYALASHSHYFQENIFETQQLEGQSIQGWLVGTAGAEQYKSDFWQSIQYGYLLIEVRADGTLNPRFNPVTRDMPPQATGEGASSLTTFCYEKNMCPATNDAFKGSCACGAIN